MNFKETDVVPYSLSPVSFAPDVWVFAPHPDDEIFGCGGALALHVQQGAHVHVVLMTAGEQQSGEFFGVRLAESEAASYVLGYANVLCWHLPDRGVVFSEQLVDRVVACLADTPTAVVYAPSLWEAHPDHRGCALTVAEAVRRSGGARELWFYEVSAPLRANTLVDVSGVWALKERAMACFASQEAVLPYSDYIGALNRYRALTVLSQGHVEAFERYPADGLAALAIDGPAHAMRRQGVPVVPADVPLVSVIVRTLGRSSLVRAVASVMAQTYSHTEVVVVNASGNVELSAEVMAIDAVRLVSEGIQLGRSAAANAGLREAKGAWLMFLDDDDWLYPDHIAKLVRAHWKKDGVVGYYSDVECLDTNGDQTGTVFAQPYVPDELMYGNFLPIHSVLFDRRVVDGGAQFDPAFDLYEDWDFWLQVEKMGRFERVPGISAAYVVGGVSGAGVAVNAERARRATDALFAKWSLRLDANTFNVLVSRSLDRRRLLDLETSFHRQQADLHQRLQDEQHRCVKALEDAEHARSDAHALRLAHDHACVDRDEAKQYGERASNDAHILRLAHDQACVDRDAARQDANNVRTEKNVLRAAHDHACADRDAARHDASLVRQDASLIRLECEVLRQQSLVLRQETDTLRHERNEARRDRAVAAHQRDQQTLLLNQSMQREQQREQEAGQREQTLAAERDHGLVREAALTHELEVVHQRLYQAELRAEQLQARFDQVVSSRSWAVTKPLRLATRVAQLTRRLGVKGAVDRGAALLASEGVEGILNRVGSRAPEPVVQGAVAAGRTYTDWVTQFDTLSPDAVSALAADLAALTHRPKVSLVMPVYNTLAKDLEAAVASVKAQIYGEWELCVCDDASTQLHVWPMLEALAGSDSRIKVIRRESNGHISAATNSALTMCTGDYVAFLDHDDVLAPHALLRVVEWFGAHPDARLVYSDEDKIGLDGQRFDPYFKPDFNLGLLRSHNYMCHFAVYERALLESLGGIRLGFEGAQDYDLALRAVDAVNPEQIGHIPHVLYHWRVTPGSTAGGHQEKSYAFLAGQRALTEHLARRGLPGEVLEAPEAPGMYRVWWALPEFHPLVSIVIPTRNGADLLRTCLDSLKTTSYKSIEVVVVDNGSDDPAALALMAQREQAGEIKVLHDPSPFNYSALNNRAVHDMCQGEFVVLMNNDIEITHPEWLAEMVGVALEPRVGCVGARLWYPDGRLQHGGVIMVCGVAGHAHKYLPKGRHGYMGRAVLTQDFLGVTAACLLIRRSVFEEVGGLDERLKIAFNDVDFCLRVHSAGYRNVWTPFAQMIHHESVTRGHEDTPEKQQRFAGEISILQTRWPELLACDPCYNPNLTNQSEDFSYAWPPRRKMP